MFEILSTVGGHSFTSFCERFSGWISARMVEQDEVEKWSRTVQIYLTLIGS